MSIRFVRGVFPPCPNISPSGVPNFYEYIDGVIIIIIILHMSISEITKKVSGKEDDGGPLKRLLGKTIQTYCI